MTSSIKKKKVTLKTDAGLPVGVAQVMNADGSLALAFDPGFHVPKATTLVKKKKKQDLYAAAYGRKSISWDDLGTGNSWGATTGRMSQQPIDWGSVTARWQQQAKWDPMYLNIPRGYGKNYDAISKFKDAFLGLEMATRESKTGLETLREANDEWMRKEQDAKDRARLAITDEKVYTFMEQNYLPYDYARKLLEEAYKDSILNEGITNAGS